MRAIRWPAPRLDLTGSVLATVLLCLSFTPSLLPRSWVMQGVVGGLTAATGYAAGTLLGYLPREALRSRGSLRVRRRAWYAYLVAAVPVTAAAMYLGWHWQGEIARMLGVAPPSAVSWPGVLPLAGVVFAVLLGAGRLICRGAGVLARVVRQERRYQAGAVLLAAVVAVHGVAVAPSWLLDGMSEALDGRVTDVAAPAEASRSGSPASYVSWASLGRQGRVFVTGPPPVYGPPPPRSPIRVYVGLRSAPTTEARARLAVAELVRTGAFTRKALCLVVPTGSGWIDEPTIRALEDEYDGDTAVAAVQYAALPSWLSFATEPDRARVAAADLLHEVDRAWSALPVATRPRLLIYGHSLGALAAQAPFGTSGDLLGKVDGALITGPPNASPLWRRLTAGRGPATTEAAPSVPGRPDILFATSNADLAQGTTDRDAAAAGAASTPGRPRLVFLQHPTDPVVWWSPRLLLHEPDWLREPPAGAVLPAVRWYPVVTFWQLSADMLAALDVPAGYGHRYGAEAPAAWHLLRTAAAPSGTEDAP